MTEPIVATSLDDLGPVVLEITVPRPDGKRVVVHVRSLTEGEAWEVRKTIDWPKPPVSDFTAGGKPVYDHNDKAYRLGLEECNRLFAQKCLIRGLQLPIPGETEAEKLQALQSKMGNYTFLLLVDASEKVNTIGADEVAAVTRSFRPLSSPSVSSDETVGAVAEPVAAVVAG